jgi:DNA-binding response OmpR family regulator
MFYPSVLIFNEDACYLSTLVRGLQREQYLVTSVDRPNQALEQLRRETYDLLILDICPTGWEDDRFLAEIRRISAFTPLITITQNPCLETALHALRFKAYDYLEKSIPIEELLTRVQDILLESRSGLAHMDILNQMQALLDNLRSTDLKTCAQFDVPVVTTQEISAPFSTRGQYTVNLNTRECSCCGKMPITLSQTEFNYWVALLRHEPEVISYKLLVKEAQNYDLSEREAMNLARWHIHGLRRIFETEWGKYPIQTIRGVGYRVLI